MLANRSLLVVDSDPDIRMTYEFLLGKIGFDVSTARNAEEGLKVCLSERPRVVLSDVVFKGMNGYDLCKNLKGDPVTQYATKFIVFTSRSESEILLKGSQVCADFYIEKPVDPNDIAADLFMLFESHMEIAPDAFCRFRVTKRIPKSSEHRVLSYSEENRSSVHLNPPVVSSSERGGSRDGETQMGMETGGQTVVVEARPQTAISEVNALLASLSGSFQQTLTRLNAVIDYIEKVDRR